MSEADIAEFIAAFKAGSSKPELDKRFGIGLRSVKKILREHGVKKRSRYEMLE